VVEYDPRLKRNHLMSLAWHRTIPGIAAMSPLLRFAPDEVGDLGATVLGVDPASLARVTWWRADFADRPLPALLRELHGTAALVSPSFLARTGLRQGDSFAIPVPGGGPPLQAVVAGGVRYFPTLDPTTSPFVLVNLWTLIAASHSPGPGELWIRAAPDRSVLARIVSRLRAAPRHVFDDTSVGAPAGSDDPLQAGIYGIVSLGFLGTLALAVLALLTYAVLAFVQRGPELAVIRTLGLTTRQTVGLLLGEQLVLVAWGAGAGAMGGTLASLLFIGYLPLTNSTVPPYVPYVPPAALLNFAGLVGAVFVALLLLESWSLRRLRLARLLRLGER
jgi:putative ABC transport system permease protein